MIIKMGIKRPGVFHSITDNPSSESTFNIIIKIADVPDDLRYPHATLLLSKGVDVKVISEDWDIVILKVHLILIHISFLLGKKK
ncbi:hypothetical protein SRABI84_05248 [Peribacillus simplex]|nr:hypothetical protein SRABI84_05248 [Peribacillus simplex]